MCFCYVSGLGVDKIIFIMSWKAQIIELTDNWLIIQYENTHPKLYFIVILQIIDKSYWVQREDMNDLHRIWTEYYINPLLMLKNAKHRQLH